ncbi:DNA-methyltransferase [Methylorubrum extorquens]|uniref:DNA-methyltransferase n=1 Tax=Methylorubrum extorquens TaxID=408 RepID=UPI0020A1DAD1|nr:site-specific DNA-methyltransferase [Methylorubrum extorquens]MCP1535694.1 adenine-specific DNA-methyltransferase [Methylorubrum extorquens]
MTFSSAQERKIAKFEHAIARLGRPACRGQRYAIYNLDCIDGMSAMPNGCVDLTVTSPPYNIGKEYETKLPLLDYLDWSVEWIDAVYNATADSGSFWLNVGYIDIPGRARALPLPYLLWDKTEFFLIQEVVWNYGAGVAGKTFLSPRNEKLLWYVKNQNKYTFNLDDIRDPDVKYPNQKKNGKLRCNTIGKNPSDVWQIAKVTSGARRSSIERTAHPAQFPLDLVDRVVKGFSNVDDIVLDPFMGSGTTAVSCLRNGRFAIGFELKSEYCQIASTRLRELENDMFLDFRADV